MPPAASSPLPHRSLLHRIGTTAGQHPWPVIVVWLLLVVSLGAVGGSAAQKLTEGGGYDEHADSWQSFVALNRAFGDRIEDVTVIYSTTDNRPVTDPPIGQAIAKVLAALPPDRVIGVVNGLEQPPQAGYVSRDLRAVRVAITLRENGTAEKSDTKQKLLDYQDIAPKLVVDHPGIRTDVGGIYSMADDVVRAVADDTRRAEGLALPIVAVLGVLIFGGLVAALLPPVVGLVALVIAMAAVSVTADHATVTSQALTVASILGLGLAIDYCLFIVNRFREELRDGRGREAAVAALGPTLATAGRTVVFSAVIVAVSMATLLVFPLAPLRSLAYGAIPAVLGAAVTSIVLLPAVLALLAHWVNAWHVPGTRPATVLPEEADRHGAWAAIAHAVMRRPWISLGAVTLLVLLLAAPFRNVHWGSVDEGVLPASAPSRQTLATHDRHFGGTESWMYAVLVGADATAATAYARQVDQQVPQLLRVVPAGTTVVDGRPHSLVQMAYPGHPNDASASALVPKVRSVAGPAGVQALVGGSNALSVDQRAVIADRLPVMLGLLAASMFVLLFLAFGSILLPVKAILVSAISILASFGIVVWGFQEGHLAGLLGFESPGYTELTTPVAMAAVLFGLSMDYEVFLLSRIREEWDRTGDNTLSVAHGLSRTGRIITGAALLLGVVVGCFVISEVIIVKMLGVAMLTALLLDATLIRGVLVPASMRLLGRWNWWLPDPLDRWWRRHQLTHT
ncbi:MAG: MMPL family transporter [Tetrasphaera sp.]